MKTSRITRRTFIKRGTSALGAVVAAPLILPSHVWGADTPSNRITLAQIGTGGRGKAHLENFLRIPDAQVIATSDAYRSRREGQAEAVDAYYTKKNGKGSYSACKAYDNFREILARDDIDAVSIATPDHWHVPMAIEAVRAGKDVYVEKPLGVAMRWSYVLRDLINAKGAIFQYGTQQRSQSQFRRACELVRNGYIGELERMDVWAPDITTQYQGFSVPQYGSEEEVPIPEDLDFDQWCGPSPIRPYTADRCTRFGTYHLYDYALGFIAGWGAHPVDIAQWGNDTDTSAPIHYEGTGTLPEKGLFDTTEQWDIHCRYPNGVQMHFMDHRTAEPIVTSYRPYKEHGTTFFGPEGWISVDRGGLHASDRKLKKAKLRKDDQALYASDNQFANFVQCVKDRKPTINPIESAVQSDLICHLSDICVRTGRTIQWDLKQEAIVNDPDATTYMDRPMRAPWGFEEG